MGRFHDVRRILVPLDFSDSARPVLDYAAEIARDLGAEITLLHVVGIPVAPFDPAYGVASDPRMLVGIQESAEKGLAELPASVAPPLATPVRTRVLTGAPSREIVRVARESGADLVVIGTHGRTGLRHVFLGSVAENVVRLAPCPVLTVRWTGFEIEKV